MFGPVARIARGACAGDLRTLASDVVTRLMSSSGALDLSGVFPPVPTAFDDSENLAMDKFASNMDKWNKMPFKGIVVLGSNGEAPMLSFEEKVELMQTARARIPSGKLLIAGSGCESTRETMKLTEAFANAGVDAALVATPWFFKGRMTHGALVAHYRRVADASPVPVILYNVPANTGVELEVETILALAPHPNIVGLKDSGGNITKLARVVHATKKEDFQVLAGSAGFLLAALHIGCVGGVCASANVLGEQTCQLQQLHQAGQETEAVDLQGRLVVPNIMVTAKFGVPALKHMMDQFGFYGGPARSPLPPLSQAERTSVEAAFAASGFVA